MRRTWVWLWIAALPALALAEGEGRQEEAMEILRKVDAEIKAVNGVRFRFETEPSGVAVNFVSASHGEGVMIGWNGGIPEKFFAQVETTNRQGEPMGSSIVMM